MKLKAILFSLLALFVATSCNARDQFTHDANVLPAAAKTLIAKNFPKLTINHIKIDKHAFEGDEYDVVLSDGTEIDFDNKGNLEEVDCGRMGNVPAAIMVKAVRDYVNKTYPNHQVVKYSVDKKGHEVELQSGIELKFNKQGAFIGYDD